MEFAKEELAEAKRQIDSTGKADIILSEQDRGRPP